MVVAGVIFIADVFAVEHQTGTVAIGIVVVAVEGVGGDGQVEPAILIEAVALLYFGLVGDAGDLVVLAVGVAQVVVASELECAEAVVFRC